MKGDETMYISGSSSKNRIVGLATGFDTDQIIKDMMNIEKLPLDRLAAKKQITQWKRDDYRSITSLLKGFKNQYMDVLTSGSSYALSSSFYKKYNTSATNNSGTQSSVVSISASGEAISGEHTVVVKQLATSDQSVSHKSINGSDISGSLPLGSLNGKSFDITLDGQSKTISFDSTSYSSVEQLASSIQSKIDTAFGAPGKVVVSGDLGSLKLTTANRTTEMIINNGGTALSDLGISAQKVSAGVSKELIGNSDVNFSTDFTGKKLSIKLDGITKDITFTDDPVDITSMKTSLQSLIDNSFGSGKVQVETSGGKISFKAVGGASKITLSEGSDSALQSLGFTNGASNRLDIYQSLGALKDQFATPLTFGEVSTYTSLSSLTDEVVSGTIFEGTSFNLNIDGTSKKISLKDNYTSVAELVSNIQVEINSAVGVGKITVSQTDGFLSFTKDSSISSMTFTSGSSEDALSKLKITSGSGASDSLNFKINGAEFNFTAKDSLSTMISQINGNASANVLMKYDEVSDKISVISKQAGAGDNIKISESLGNFWAQVSKTDMGKVTSEGMDSEAYIDGQLIVRSGNNVSVNGINYTFLQKSQDSNGDGELDSENVSISMNVDGIYENIKGMVEKYNEMIDSIYKKLGEEYDRSYQPLTEEQKRDLSSEEVVKWEEKAKMGLMRNDSLLQKIVYDMRSAITSKIQGVSAYITDIGISTGSYTDKGKLSIDETKLKEAIRTNPDGVMNIFNKKSETAPSYSRTLNTDERKARFEESGIFQRLFDVVEDNISTYRDSNGKKGILLEKAGIIGDASEFNNSMYKELYNYENSINEISAKLAKKEENYYQKYANLERVIQQMSSQSAWLASQFGGG